MQSLNFSQFYFFLRCFVSAFFYKMALQAMYEVRGFLQSEGEEKGDGSTAVCDVDILLRTV